MDNTLIRPGLPANVRTLVDCTHSMRMSHNEAYAQATLKTKRMGLSEIIRTEIELSADALGAFKKDTDTDLWPSP